MITTILKKIWAGIKTLALFGPEFKDQIDPTTRRLGILGNLLRSILLGFSGPPIFIAVYNNIDSITKNIESILVTAIGIVITMILSDDNVIEWIHRNYSWVIIADIITLAIANLFVEVSPVTRVIIIATFDMVLMRIWCTGYDSALNRVLSGDTLTKWCLILGNAHQLGYLIGLIIFLVLESHIHLAIPLVCAIQVVGAVIDGWADNKVHAGLLRLAEKEKVEQ